MTKQGTVAFLYGMNRDRTKAVVEFGDFEFELNEEGRFPLWLPKSDDRRLFGGSWGAPDGYTASSPFVPRDGIFARCVQGVDRLGNVAYAKMGQEPGGLIRVPTGFIRPRSNMPFTTQEDYLAVARAELLDDYRSLTSDQQTGMIDIASLSMLDGGETMIGLIHLLNGNYDIRN